MVASSVPINSGSSLTQANSHSQSDNRMKLQDLKTMISLASLPHKGLVTDYTTKMGYLRTVPPFVTAHTFSASSAWSKILGFLKEFGS